MTLTKMGLSPRAVRRYSQRMHRAKIWFGVLVVSFPVAFVACGDDAEDDGGDGGGNRGGTSGTGGSNGGSPTGGKGGTAGTTGGNGGTSGSSGTSPSGGTGGDSGSGGQGGEDGGQGGEAGDPHGGTAGISMGGAGGAMAGGGAGGKAGGGATAGGGAGGKAGGGGGGATAGGGAGGAGGKAGGGAGGAGAGGAGASAGGAGAGGAGAGGAGAGGSGGVAPTCDPTPPPEIYVGVLNGAEEVPANNSAATGIAIAELNPEATQLTVSVYWENLGSNTTIGHIHGPAPAGMTMPPVFDLAPTAGAMFGSVVAKPFAISAPQLAQLRASLYYANIHSATFPNGEIRAQLLPATTLRTGTLSGAQENPANASPGTGRAVAVVFPGNTQAAVSVTWSALSGTTSIGHIHGPAPAGMNAGILFDLVPPAGANSGSVTHRRWIFDAGEGANLLGNLTYANIHSAPTFGAGEIRAQLLPPCPI